ncbi:hypothetical protein N7I30_00165 [Aurantimonas litoralis]|nr:hypothetical protein [Aurantimonas litoralis]
MTGIVGTEPPPKWQWLVKIVRIGAKRTGNRRKPPEPSPRPCARLPRLPGGLMTQAPQPDVTHARLKRRQEC